MTGGLLRTCQAQPRSQSIVHPEEKHTATTHTASPGGAGSSCQMDLLTAGRLVAPPSSAGSSNQAETAPEAERRRDLNTEINISGLLLQQQLLN